MLKNIRNFIFLLVAALVVLIPATATTAAPQSTITVNSLADDLDLNGNCTLREALRAASLNTVWDGCAAGSPTGSDLIVFSVNGTIHLDLGEYIISSPVTIQGNGRSQTIIDAGGDSRIIRIEDTSISLASLTLQNGDPPPLSYDGGAIYAHNPLINGVPATLLLDDVVIQDNQATFYGGAISGYGLNVIIDNSLFQRNEGTYGAAIALWDGALSVQNSILQQNIAKNYGGGIYTRRITVEIDRTLIQNNQVIDPADDYMGGGGVYLFRGSLVLTASTIRDNIVEQVSNGGGLLADGVADISIEGSTISGNHAERGRGGGIFYDTTEIYGITDFSIENSTISTNIALLGGGVFITTKPEDTDSSIRFSTLVNNTALASLGAGGAIFLNPGSAPLVLTRSIIYGNTGLPACYPSGGLTAGGFNLLQETSCGNSGTDLIGINPQLAPLADNGGPTLTHALDQISPAINAIPCLPNVVTDQRGVSRPQGASCDSGAFEFGGALPAMYLPLALGSP